MLTATSVAFAIEVFIFSIASAYGDIDSFNNTNNLTMALSIFMIIVSYHFIVNIMMIPTAKEILNAIRPFLKSRNIYVNSQISKQLIRKYSGVVRTARKYNLKRKLQTCKITCLILVAGYILLSGSYDKQRSLMELNEDSLLSYLEAFFALFCLAIFFVIIIAYIASTGIKDNNKSIAFYIMINDKKFYILYPINNKELLLSSEASKYESKNHIILNRQDLSGKEIIQESLTT